MGEVNDRIIKEIVEIIGDDVPIIETIKTLKFQHDVLVKAADILYKEVEQLKREVNMRDNNARDV